MSEWTIRITDPQTTLARNPPEFYIDNMFHIDDPDTGIRWLDVIKPSDVRNLRKIWISVHAVYNPGPYTDFITNNPPNGPRWRELLAKLSTEAECLEEMVLYLDSEPIVNHWGPAVDAEFVRTLGKFSNLQKLEIRGYFPKEWPSYLEVKTGLRVWQEEGQREQYLSSLREFQTGLKDQIL